MRNNNKLSLFEPLLELQPKDWLICLGCSVAVLGILLCDVAFSGMLSLGKLAIYLTVSLCPPILVGGIRFILKPNNFEEVENILSEALQQMIIENVKSFQNLVKLHAKYALPTLTWLAPNARAAMPPQISVAKDDAVKAQISKKLR